MSLNKNTSNGIERTTGVVPSASGTTLFEREFVFTSDAAPPLAHSERHEVRNQHLDAVYGRGQNEGRGVVGEGGDAGPGVVGIAGGTLPRPEQAFPRKLDVGFQPGRGGVRAGVIGVGGAQPSTEAFGILGNGGAIGVLGESDTAPGVQGNSNASDGIVGQSQGDGKSGVYGFNSSERGWAYGVTGRSHSTDGVGVYGVNDNGDGVFGSSKRGRGVRGNSKADDGIAGFTEARDKSGLRGENASPSPDPSSPVPLGGFNACGVTGEAHGSHGTGVCGLSEQGNGLAGRGGRYGATLAGAKAPLRLSPSADIGPPPTAGHTTGELYVDNNGDLFFFRAGAWFRVNLTPA